jgi:hypothetical protein
MAMSSSHCRPRKEQVKANIKLKQAKHHFLTELSSPNTTSRSKTCKRTHVAETYLFLIEFKLTPFFLFNGEEERVLFNLVTKQVSVVGSGWKKMGGGRGGGRRGGGGLDLFPFFLFNELHWAHLYNE